MGIKQSTVRRQGERGFTLLIALIFMAVVLSIGLALGSLGYKQEVLASSALESQVAFYAADAGLECALRADQQQGDFAYSKYNSAAPTFTEACGGTGYPVSTLCYNSPAGGCAGQWVMSWAIPLSYPDPKTQSANTERSCAVVTLYKPSTVVAGGGSGFAASGGSITTSGGYTVHTFTSSGTFTPNGSGTVEVLAVGGGGGGGSGNSAQCVVGGGGGAGGLAYQSSQAVSAQSYSVTVGSGGAGGSNSALNDGLTGGASSFGTLISAAGGGGGGYANCSGTGANGLSGASGGGGGWGTNGTGAQQGGAGVSGQGNRGAASQSGGTSGGGGGAASAASGGAGGAGALNTISGSATVYATGGQGNTTGLTAGVASPAAAANSGNGGAGGWSASGGAGGSGIVIVRYPTSPGSAAGTTYVFSQGYDVACSSITKSGVRFASRGLSATYSD